MLQKKLKGFLQLARPAEWSKTLMNMLFGAFLAVQALPDISTFVLGFVSAAFLWGSLYTFNDITDIEKDRLHPVKKNRALPSGLISKNQAIVFGIILLAVSVCIGLVLSYFFFACLLAMFVNQALYTFKPFRFKERAVLDIVSGSMINPLFRFFCGWALFAQNFNAPLLFLLFVVCLQAGGFTLYRASGKDTEKKLGYKSSFVLFGEKKIRAFSFAMIAIGALSFLLVIVSGNFIPWLVPFGTLPFKFAWLIVLSLLFIPFYAPALKPEKMNIRRMYKILYVHLALFCFLFIALWLI